MTVSTILSLLFAILITKQMSFKFNTIFQRYQQNRANFTIYFLFLGFFFFGIWNDDQVHFYSACTVLRVSGLWKSDIRGFAYGVV